ncbi:drug resistance transporter, EmrB/QacA subfamily [Geodermatophilus obscurus]|uniref:Drug resistance transporter, EmrB/QacA subfamily n=1 Tax=Geodermatophilus obscurus TaxID=1861 RepID=A0A1I5IKZ5_9ACTN|nr:MFS transporter [Geodermatophilus obscurus]SFO60846.1 drug resistance transporter, EmrB/QacA subfamily [Geodermatophilus obscurus]
METTVPAAGRADAPPRRPGVLLAIACAAQFICVLDTSIVNVALPPMQESLGLSATGLQWVVSSYTLTFAGFLLLGGRIGDLWGRKNAFLGGLTLFALASLAGGLAQEGWQLVAARFAQGIGGAVLVPTTLSLITAGFPDPRARARALGLLTAAAASGSALGGVLGGLLTGLLSWRWVLFVNVPLGAVLAVAAVWALTGRQPGHVRGRLDLPGSVTVTAGTALLVAAVILGEERGWLSAPALGCLVGAGASFVAFVAAERRAEQPVVPLSVLRVRPVTVANSLSALTGGVLPAMMFFLVLYLQQVLGLDPLMAGLALAPAAVGIALGAQVASRTIERLGPARLFQLGALVAAASLFWLSRLEVGGSYWTDVLVPSVLAMAGFGAAGLPLTVTAATGLGPERAGLASGLLSMSRQVGSAVGLAALVAVASTGTPGASAEALTQGFGIGLLAGAGLQVAACLGGFALPRRPHHPS